MRQPIYLEAGRRRTFAGALEWPGWSRAGKTEDEALAALVAYGARYKRALGRHAAGFELPAEGADLEVVERLEGNATTDFGAPGVIPDADRATVSDAELERLVKILDQLRAEFERSVRAARGQRLRPAGPRGGGRELDSIVDHVRGADGSYARAIGAKVTESASWPEVREAFTWAVFARAHGELPEMGPRGGERWPARYGIRRSAWHVLDHCWEIEDRLES